MEESAANSAKRIQEETEESASEVDTETAGGVGEVGTTLMPTSVGPEGSGA